jgi:ElaB/YqjD/DUF883 family membrane-anchored ribosome-binding protein
MAIVDVVRYAVQCSGDARRISSMAQDALEESMYEATRAAKLMKHRVQEFGDAATHYVKREPVKAIGIAAGVALAVGVAVGCLATRALSAAGTKRRPRLAWR